MLVEAREGRRRKGTHPRISDCVRFRHRGSIVGSNFEIQVPLFYAFLRTEFRIWGGSFKSYLQLYNDDSWVSLGLMRQFEKAMIFVYA